MPVELGVRDIFVLGRVSTAPTYGHEINRTIAVSRADLWVELSEKHVYYVLKKLAKAGLVDAEPGGAATGAGRQVYRITAEGRKALAAALAAPRFAESVAYSDFDTVLAMLAYTDVLTDEERTAVLRLRLQEIERRLGEEYAPLMGKHIQKRFGATARALYDRGRMTSQADRGWLVELIDEVERDGWDAFRVREGVGDDQEG